MYEVRQIKKISSRKIMNKVKIKLEEWDHTCSDGCCYSYGTYLIMNGKKLEHPNPEILDNSYVGDDVETALIAVLKELGYEVEFYR
jgi:hypothetical protein